MTEVVPFLGRRTALLKTIREILVDSSKVSFEPARKKGTAGKLAMSQVWECLEEGALTNDPILDEHGNYLCELHLVSSGQDVYLTIAVDIQDVTDRNIILLHISEG